MSFSRGMASGMANGGEPRPTSWQMPGGSLVHGATSPVSPVADAPGTAQIVGDPLHQQPHSAVGGHGPGPMQPSHQVPMPHQAQPGQAPVQHAQQHGQTQPPVDLGAIIGHHRPAMNQMPPQGPPAPGYSPAPQKPANPQQQLPELGNPRGPHPSHQGQNHRQIPHQQQQHGHDQAPRGYSNSAAAPNPPHQQVHHPHPGGPMQSNGHPGQEAPMNNHGMPPTGPSSMQLPLLPTAAQSAMSTVPSAHGASTQQSGMEPPHSQAPHAQQGTQQGQSGEHTYANLQEGIVGHIFFPLVLKKMFELFTGRPLVASHIASHFSDLEDRAMGLKSYAEIHGLDGACENWAGTDVFMSALVSALTNVKTHLATTSIDPLLAETLSATSAFLRNSGGAGQGGFGPNGNDSLLAPIGSLGDKPNPAIMRGRARPLGVAQALPRRKLKPMARRCLEDWFQAHINSPYPSEAEKQELANQCQLDIQQVNNFFGNKRMRMKRKMMAMNSTRDGQKADGITDSVLAPKSKWRAVVLSKLESNGNQFPNGNGGNGETGPNDRYQRRDSNQVDVPRRGPMAGEHDANVLRREGPPPGAYAHGRRGGPMEAFYAEEDVAAGKTAAPEGAHPSGNFM